MRTNLELLIALYNLYSDGKLCSEFNKIKNKMENHPDLVAIMEDVFTVIPERKAPKEAAASMRDLTEEARTEAIESSEGKVIDLRSAFARKIATNGGAHGLVKELLEASGQDDHDRLVKVLEDMSKFVEYNEGAE